MRQKVILDCDPGHDDAVALLLAARHPAVELLAVTTVAGNQSVEKTSLNALKICTLAQIDGVPVAKGMERPLLRAPQHAADIHGESGLDGPQLPEPDRALAPQHAVDLLIELLLNSQGDITLVATGPLTNVAAAMQREPAILPKIKAISLMGGAISVGNVTPAAEFNIWVDPEAAAVVFDCGRPITMVPLEVTHKVLATGEILAPLRAAAGPVPKLVVDMMAFFGETYSQMFGFAAPPLHDPCAVAAVIDASLFCSQAMRVEIETVGQWSTGRTVCDMYGKWGREPNVHVAYGIDAVRFWTLLTESLLSY